MVVYAVIVSTVIAFIRHDEKKMIIREGIKLFLYMSGGVILASWIINFL